VHCQPWNELGTEVQDERLVVIKKIQGAGRASQGKKKPQDAGTASHGRKTGLEVQDAKNVEKNGRSSY